MINIGNIYGSQESKTIKDEVEKSWLRFVKDIQDIEDRNEAILLIGDMNRSIGIGKYGIGGNTDKVSFGGQLIRNFIKERPYILINDLDIARGGTWTWVDRKDNRRKSILDLAIMSESLLPYIAKVEIDSEKKFTPRRVMKRKNCLEN